MDAKKRKRRKIESTHIFLDVFSNLGVLDFSIQGTKESVDDPFLCRHFLYIVRLLWESWARVQRLKLQK